MVPSNCGIRTRNFLVMFCKAIQDERQVFAYSPDNRGKAIMVGSGVATGKDDGLTGTDTYLVPTTQHVATIHGDNTI